MSNEHYLHNPLIHRDRRLGRRHSPWVKQFDCSALRPLIICRGPIRKEAMDVFAEMGITGYGILLSEKDSIVYQDALAPELRTIADPGHVHRVPDYTGANKEEREQRIRQIIRIAQENGYDSVFAGYGFMAEDENMVAALEAAGLNFIGPCSRTVHDAGLKDEAKRTALRAGVSVTPGIDNATALTLLRKYPALKDLKALVDEHALDVNSDALDDSRRTLEDKADLVLAASYEKGVDLYTVEELCETITGSVASMFREYPENRVRLKAISGGGGKGQRILPAPSAYEGDEAARLEQASAKAPELVREILNEVKTTGVGDNKNVLIELNIETIRHQEIQVIGNGDWSMSLGGRDCSLQMHEQKLLEVSVTVESLQKAIAEAEQTGSEEELRALRQDLVTLEAMEDEAARFGEAVGLDSVSTFECIVDRDSHFFMEMNTRIQVEHRVTELCYSLRFSNPDNPEESFVVESLVEAMVLLAAHGPRLPKPQRVLRHDDSVEARLNATNQALQPSAGGLIEYWSDAIEGEIRDDQGISVHNPDTDVFIKYRLAGAYDSNIALLLRVGESRLEAYRNMAETLRRTRIYGRDLATNLQFHYGLVNWFIGRNINARPTTRFVVPYLTAVGLLQEQAHDIDLDHAWAEIQAATVAKIEDAEAAAWRQVFADKHTLVLRPLQLFFRQPHLLAGWLSVNRSNYSYEGARVRWLCNPVELLAEMYHFLNMDHLPGNPAATMIWDHDDEILQRGLAFYRQLRERLGIADWPALCDVLDAGEAPQSINRGTWQEVVAAHRGFQAGMEVLGLLPLVAHETGFFDLSVNPDLTVHIPERLTDPDLQSRMQKVLAPPPEAKADEILAVSGGMFYARETPEHEVYVQKGDHVEAGDPLYIVEVMKMFNKVYAPFACTIDEVLVDADGVIIQKGQPLFKVTPDEKIDIVSPQEIAATRRRVTDSYLENII